MKKFFILILCTACISVQFVKAQEKAPEKVPEKAPEKAPLSPEELAKKLANPIANLISVPFQTNVDVGTGYTNGSKMVVNFQPVIPFTISPKFNLITRWIIPIASQYDIGQQPTSAAGIGDAVISAFLSPTGSKITWGVGPAIVVPSATKGALGGKKWAVGPSVVGLKQAGPWTYGLLLNHVFSVAGDENRADYSASFFNPFLTYNWKGGAGVNLIVEYTHEWESKTDILVIIPTLSAVAKLGKQTTSFGIGPRFNLAPDGHPAYGLRAAITLVFPK